jgi:hypothetical protein
LPVEVRGLLPPNGVTLGIAVRADGWTLGRRATGLSGDRPLLATHCLIHLLLCSPMYSCSVASRSHSALFTASAVFALAANAVPPDKPKAAAPRKRADVITNVFDMVEILRRTGLPQSVWFQRWGGRDIFPAKNEWHLSLKCGSMDQTNKDVGTERKTASRRSLRNPIRWFDQGEELGFDESGKRKYFWRRPLHPDLFQNWPELLAKSVEGRSRLPNINYAPAAGHRSGDVRE